MTTAVSETVRETEVLRRQAQAIRGVIQRNVDGLTQEESLIQPAPGGNCLNWVVGHLVDVYNQMLPLVGQKPVGEDGAFKRYARGTPPLENPAEALDFQDLLAALNEATDRADAGLASVTQDMLDKSVPQHSPTKNPNETVRSLLSTVLFHQAYHAGQTGLLRRIAGKPGAIA
jgi:uncharacterized damage-inducible protein DinB